MHYVPMNYNHINAAAGTTSPAAVKSYNNRSFAYWERSLFQRAQSVIDFSLPENWQGSVRDFFLYCLFRYGFIAISKNDKYGQYFQPCALSGYDFYYQPTKAIIANPDYHAELKIHEECEILKITPDYIGIWDVIMYYAEKFSTLDNAINMSLINCKYPFFIGAKNKTASSALKKMLDLANKGEPAVIYDMKLMNDPNDKDMPFQIWDRGNLKECYLTTDQLNDFKTILSNFDTEIGIPSVGYEKKERLITDEVQLSMNDGCARSVTWINTLTSSISDVKKLYPEITLDAKLHYNNEAQKEGDQNE